MPLESANESPGMAIGDEVCHRVQHRTHNLSRTTKTTKIGFVNARSLKSDDTLYLLDTQAIDLGLSVIGISEVKRKQAASATLPSGSAFYCSDPLSKLSAGGVGFWVHKDYVNSIVSCSFTSGRLGILNLKEVFLLVAYAPTSNSSDEEAIQFYDDLSDLKSKAISKKVLIMGDFNGSIGKDDLDAKVYGRYGFDSSTNARGLMLKEFAEENNFKIMNTFFQKRPSRKFTWISPNGSVKKEIDYFLAKDQRICFDVTTLSERQFNIGSDHKMIKLYDGPDTNRKDIFKRKYTPPPKFLYDEVRTAIMETNPHGAPGLDELNMLIIQQLFPAIGQHMLNMFNTFLERREVPIIWKRSDMILLFKKGSPKQIENYRPISLICTLGKVFGKLLLNRLTKEITKRLPKSQTGFRAGFSTYDNILTLSLILQKAREYKFGINIIFVDFLKAFDSISLKELFRELGKLDDKGVVDMLKELNLKTSLSIKAPGINVDVNTKSGVRQGDTPSPTLFNMLLAKVTRALGWDEVDCKYGLMVNGEKLVYFAYADDIAIVALPGKGLEMLQALEKEALKVGLKINFPKTKYFSNCNEVIDTIEKVDNFTFLGHEANIEGNQAKETSRRKQSAWKAYHKIKDISKHLSDLERGKLYSQFIRPCLTYSCSCYSLRKGEVDGLRRTETSILRRLMGKVRPIGNAPEALAIHNVEVYANSKVKPLPILIAEQKLSLLGHLVRREDNRCDHLDVLQDDI
uniref:Reverse transcriptase domain-containing protein n=1 Tax=Rhabditophanes sp. KR3021 TaxID=114890 RepID=A0AC35UC55_9BILA